MARSSLHRGLATEAVCPRGCGQEESVMHLLRDCLSMRKAWRSLIEPSKAHLFFSLQSEEWIRWNFNNEVGREFMKKVPWSTLFGYLCWDIWTHRCTCLFGVDQESKPLNPLCSLFKACADQDVLQKLAKSGSRQAASALPIETMEGDVELYVDGSVLGDGRSGCGGVALRGVGNWIVGFSYKLIGVPPVIAELLACLHGLHLCWARGFRNICLFSDCIEAINFLLRGCEDQHPYADIITDVRLLMNRDWNVKVYHVYREHSRVADQLAKMSHRLPGNFAVFDQQPPALLSGGD